MTTLAIGLIMAALLPQAAKISQGQRDLGVVVLRELTVKDEKLVIRVESGGCTDKAAIRANVQKEKGLTERAPHYVVTFERVGVDACKALLLEGALLEYDLVQDLHISGTYTLSVTNWVFPRSEDSLIEERSLQRRLVVSTVRAIEMELRGYEEKQKTAESGVGPPGNAELFKKRIAELKGREEALQKMNPFDYPLAPAQEESPEAVLLKQPRYGPVMPPVKKIVAVTVKDPVTEGSILDVEGMTRSGPFYQVAGVGGEGYGRLEPGSKYQLTLYLVYEREYVGRIPSYYVYVADVK